MRKTACRLCYDICSDMMMDTSNKVCGVSHTTISPHILNNTTYVIDMVTEYSEIVSIFCPLP